VKEYRKLLSAEEEDVFRIVAISSPFGHGSPERRVHIEKRNDHTPAPPMDACLMYAFRAVIGGWMTVEPTPYFETVRPGGHVYLKNGVPLVPAEEREDGFYAPL